MSDTPPTIATAIADRGAINGLLALLLATITLGTAAIIGWGTQDAAAAAPAAAFEYLVVPTNRIENLGEDKGSAIKTIDGVEVLRDLTAGLNQLGKAGWELVTIDESKSLCYLKRAR